MPGRIVLFGATGYTGRLTADALVARGERPLLGGRSRERLEEMAAELGGLEIATADVSRPDSVRALLEPGDVMLSTVGPFARFGDPAAAAAIDAGAHYLDSTGEPAFIRRVFEHFGPRAERAGIGMLTAFGWDWVPGNLAGALALREAGGAATRVDIGYYSVGNFFAGMSGGTRASMAGALIEPAFAWRDGIRTERPAMRVRAFDVDGKRRQGISVGSSEHFALPRLHRQLREVNVYLGWFGPASRAMQGLAAFNAAAVRVPGVKPALERLTSRFEGSTGGPDADERAQSGSAHVAIAYDDAGTELATVHLRGGNGYEFTGRILAWGAATAAAGGISGEGALGPAEAFGLDALTGGCAEAGMRTV